MSSSRTKALSLYRSLLREAEKFSSYNFRTYALRRIRDGFREKQNLSDQGKISESIVAAEQNLAMIKRQVIVGNLYSADKLIIEKDKLNMNSS